MIRIDCAWLAIQPLDMRAGPDTALARVVKVFGAAHPHHAYLFANKRANRVKVLVHDGIGIWLAARRLHQGKFVWPRHDTMEQVTLSRAQLNALVLGLRHRRASLISPSPSLRQRCSTNSQCINPGQLFSFAEPIRCQGVKGFKETGRSRYITDAEFDQVKAQAHFTVVDAMDLALLTGQRPADVLKLKRTDIRDGALWIVQNKTGARLGIEITGELAATITRVNERSRHAISAYLIQDENGQPLTQCALRSRFDKARTLAKVDFQFRDIRAKAATDTGDLAHSQKLLAHKNREMTEHYVKARMGERVKPLR